MEKHCEDSYITFNALKEEINFEELEKEIIWHTMKQRDSLVPRLISIQGEICEDGTHPLYRHPVDEQPELINFSPTILKIKNKLEEMTNQKLNHVLIQLYRNGKDNIGEHADKTLDIEKDTNIINYSLGATRYLRLRTKNKTKNEKTKIKMENNSLFILGPITNKKWLHLIKPDKRLDSLKTKDELLCNCKRISLTFRSIATYITKEGKIIGQGAKKDMNNKEDDTMEMLKAFSKENHEDNYEWDEIYGNGFNSLNFKILNIKNLL